MRSTHHLQLIHLLVVLAGNHHNVIDNVFSPDPSLTVENMNRVMAKVEPKEREEVYERVLDYESLIKWIQEQYSTDSERDMAYVNAFINCDPSSSWHKLAKVLYEHHYVAAIEEMRSYLTPRGMS